MPCFILKSFSFVGAGATKSTIYEGNPGGLIGDSPQLYSGLSQEMNTKKVMRHLHLTTFTPKTPSKRAPTL
jgi:hypothetical protein